MDDDDVVFCPASTLNYFCESFSFVFFAIIAAASAVERSGTMAEQRVRGEMNLNFNEEDDDDEARKARMELCWVITGED